jgi:hypothetical protein
MIIGSFLRLRNDVLARLEQVVVVRYMARRYLFFVVSKMELLDVTDPVLEADIYKRTSLAVCGLQYIMDSKEYVIKAPADGPWNDAEPDHSYFMTWTWYLDYM